MSDTKQNMRLWDALGKTDPKQTKKFTRSGGFKGTAIKPIWCVQRMTEQFGPCGIGWGMNEPSFTTQNAGEEMLVFCTVGLWYKDGAEISSPVYGVGGDKFLIQGSNGSRTSDEAFKGAFTDALGNAMKFIGVAADVHMGRFDDSKYVQEVAAEFAEEPPEPAQSVKPKLISSKDAQAFRDACTENNKSAETVKAALRSKGINNSASIPASEYKVWMEWARGEADLPPGESVQ